MWLLYISCAWVFGIFLGSKVSIPLFALPFGLLPLLFIPLAPNSKKTLIVAALCLFALLGGSLRFASSLPQIDEHSLCFYNDKGTAEMQGMVADEPDVGSRSCSLKLSASGIGIDAETEEVSGTALIQLPRYPAYHYGDMLRVTGELETPAPFDGFDYRSYLAQQGIYSVIYYPKVEVLDTGQGFKPLEWLYSFRGQLSDSLAQALPEPQGSLAQGILLGVRSNIPDSLSEAFSRTGTAHLLAISGLHVGIVIGMVLISGVLLFGRHRSIYIWLAFVTIWLYVLLTGMRPPVVRAAIMGSLFLVAEYLGRQRNAITALAFAAAVMVGIQPQILWSVSFQLSFLAMAGLILLFPYFQAWGRRGVMALSGDRESLTTAGNFVTDALALSLAAIVATWPLIAYNFGVVSLVGLPATFFSLPALPAIIVTAALVAFAGLFAPLLAQILGWIAWVFLSYLLFVVQAFDALPFSSFEVGVQPWHIWVYYVVLALIMVYVSRREQLAGFSSRLASGARRMAGGVGRTWSRFPRKWAIPPLLIAAILVWSVLLTMPDDKLHVSFLDVGQGDAILVQQGSQQVLIDGGPDPQRINLELSEKLPFWDRTIELMVSTQPHSDHITGLVEVLERYKVEQVFEPGVPYDSSVYHQWIELVEQKGIKHEIARAGQEIDLGNGLKMEVLNPPEEFFQGTSSDVDNNGVVLRLTSGNVSFLLTADIREEAEFELVRQRANLTSTVLKAAHHGSKTSTTPQFLAAVDPEIAVISAGADNPFGHPSAEVVERLEEKLGEDRVYLTSEDGTIEFITDGERLWVMVERWQNGATSD
jgi:competence protein ComEC